MGRCTTRPGCLRAWHGTCVQPNRQPMCVPRCSCETGIIWLTIVSQPPSLCFPPSSPAPTAAMPRTCTTTRWPPCCMVRSACWLPDAWPCKGGSMRCPRLVPAALHDTHPAPAHAIRPANLHAPPPPAVPAAGNSLLPAHLPSTGAIHTLMGPPYPQASPATCACPLA